MNSVPQGRICPPCRRSCVSLRFSWCDNEEGYTEKVKVRKIMGTLKKIFGTALGIWIASIWTVETSMCLLLKWFAIQMPITIVPVIWIADQHSNGGLNNSPLTKWCSEYLIAMVPSIWPFNERTNPHDLNTEQVLFKSSAIQFVTSSIGVIGNLDMPCKQIPHLINTVIQYYNL